MKRHEKHQPSPALPSGPMLPLNFSKGIKSLHCFSPVFLVFLFNGTLMLHFTKIGYPFLLFLFVMCFHYFTKFTAKEGVNVGWGNICLTENVLNMCAYLCIQNVFSPRLHLTKWGNEALTSSTPAFT